MMNGTRINLRVQFVSGWSWFFAAHVIPPIINESPQHGVLFSIHFHSRFLLQISISATEEKRGMGERGEKKKAAIFDHNGSMISLAISLLVAERERADSAISLLIAERERADSAISLLVAERERADSAISLLVAEIERADSAISLLIAERERADSAISLLVAESERADSAISLLVAERERSDSAISDIEDSDLMPQKHGALKIVTCGVGAQPPRTFVVVDHGFSTQPKAP
jgi:hypothetical protein